jgi:hypothetical protein
MKHRHRAAATAPRTPREIHVRITGPRPNSAEQPPEVWVVNGRIIRFLDPSRPAVDAPRPRPHRFGLLRALAHR